jgi:hypothetical protein
LGWPTWSVLSLDVDVLCAGVGLGGGQLEVTGSLAQDFKFAVGSEDANGPDFTPGNATSTANQGQKPSRLGLTFLAQVHLKNYRIPGKVGT